MALPFLLGDRYLGGCLDAQLRANAVRRGYEDLQAVSAAQAPKPAAAPAKRVPRPTTGGSVGATQAQPEPKDVQEAIKRARKRLLGG